MRKLVVVVALTFFLMDGPWALAQAVPTLAAGSSEDQWGMTIRKTVGEVRLGFDIYSPNGRPVAGLERKQIAVYQDRQLVSDLTSFHAIGDLPLQLVLMIDASDSMREGFERERAAASSFLRRVVRPGIDQSAVASFSMHTSMALDDGSPLPGLHRIDALQSSGLTALFDAIYETAAHLPAFDRQPGLTRRVLVLLSDGDDTYSRHSLADAVAASQRADIAIYAIAAHSRNQGHWGDANLEKLTTASGGRVFYLKNYDQSEKVFAEIEREIRSQYSVTFRPEGDTCGFHSVEVKTNDPALRTRTRMGFYGDCL